MNSLLKIIRQKTTRLGSLDWVLFFSVLTLLLLGLAAIYSVDLSRNAGDLLNVKKQTIALVIGLVIACIFALSNYKMFESYHVIIYSIGILLLIAVLFFGHTIRGSRGWFILGPVSFQPVEFVKLSVIISLSTYFSKRARRFFGWKEFLESLAIVLLPVGITLLQPDFGSACVLLGIWFVMTLFAGMPIKQFVVLFSSSLFLLLMGWFVFFADYQKARIMTFFDPTKDPLGQGYNVAQAIIAIGAGGLFGRGLGFGTQSQLKFLPESQTDFIFAVIAEELGFIGVTILLCAIGFFVWRIFRLARLSHDSFTSFILLGIVSVIFLQVFVNVGMNLGIFPVTGIGLPFVSYGGSSLVFFLSMIGIAESVALRTVRVT